MPTYHVNNGSTYAEDRFDPISVRRYKHDRPYVMMPYVGIFKFLFSALFGKKKDE